MIQKNKAGQGIYLFAKDTATGLGKTGDAANITVSISKDGGANATSTNSVSEIGNGFYTLSLEQGETNCDRIAISAVSSTSAVVIDPTHGFTDGGGVNANIVSSELAASVLGEGVAGTTWTFTNATTVEQNFTLGDITGWKKLWCGVKRSKENEDADALILIEESNPDDSSNDGLQYINGAEAETKGNGSLTVSDESAGTVAFALDAAEAKKLPTIEGVFEFKWMDANDKVHILSTRGVCNIQRAYVQDVS